MMDDDHFDEDTLIELLELETLEPDIETSDMQGTVFYPPGVALATPPHEESNDDEQVYR